MRVPRDITYRAWWRTLARVATLVITACCYLAPVAASGAGPAVSKQPEGTLTLDEAITLALASSPEVAAAERSLELAQMRLSAAEALRRPTISLRAWPAQISRPQDRASLMPAPLAPAPTPEPEGIRLLSSAGLDVCVPISEMQITLSIDGTYLSGSSVEPDTDLGWSLSVSHPLLGPGSSLPGSAASAGRAGTGPVDSQVRAATAAVRSASFALEQAREKARASLEAAYHAALRDRRKLEAAEMNLERVKQHLAVTEARFEQGNASGLDVLDARQRVAAAEVALDAARHAVVLSDMSVNRVTGRSLETPVSLAPVGEYVPGKLPGVETCVKTALERRKELALAAQDVSDQEAELASARKELLPSVALVGGAKDDGSWSIGVQLTKTLTRDLGAEAVVKAADDAVVSARERLESTKTAVVVEVTEAYYGLLEAEATLSLAKSGLERARLALDTVQEQYRLGAATHQDVATAIAAVHDAEVELADATAACFMARSRLTRAMGAAG
ncbi:MAG: TolC family protein [Bacillota bacterium]|nr:TolC family protein [Bacillota bacterium]